MPTNSGMELPTHKAVRLIFEYDGDTVRLVSQQNVEMAVTGFDMSGVDHPGYYVDTRDAAGATLARVAAHGAFRRERRSVPGKAGRSDHPCRGCRAQGRVHGRRAGHRRREPRRRDKSRARCRRTGATRRFGTRRIRCRRDRHRHVSARRTRSAHERWRYAMSTADGSVLGNAQIFGGAPRNRAFNVVMLADGFTAAQQNDFNNACAAFVTAFTRHAPVRRAEAGHQRLPGQRDIHRLGGGRSRRVRAARAPPRARTSTAPSVRTESAGCSPATTRRPCRRPRRRFRNSRWRSSS